MIKIDDNDPSEDVLGLIDEATPIGREYTIGDDLWKYMGMNGNLLIFSINGAPACGISMKTWKNEYRYKCRSYFDPL